LENIEQQQSVMSTLEQEEKIKKERTMVKITYALFALSIFIQVLAIVACIIAYIKREDVKETYLATHYDWLIKTFWILLGVGVGCVLLMILSFGLGTGLSVVLIIGAGIWYLYRVIKGFLKFNDALPIQ
jgi:uncharacterized membrane protein